MSTMARRLTLLAAITALTAVGCGDDDGDDGTPVDMGTDMTTPPVDMGGIDMGDDDEDMGGDDVDMGGDDTDMGGDDTDMFVPDPGGGAATSAQIQAVIDAADGDVTLMIEDAVVSFTKLSFGSGVDDAGFFVQAEQMGPALYVAIDPSTLTPPVEAGDVIDFQVTTKSTNAGIPFAEVIDSYAQDSTGNDTSFLVQDVTAVDLVTDLDDYTSELVSITGATIEDTFGFAGSGFGGAQITTTGVATATSDFRLRVPDDVRTGGNLGIGCTVDVGPSPMWRFNASAQPSAWDPADFSVTACPAPEAGDIVVTEIGYTFAGADDDKEFIELHNPTENAFDLGGCILADENGPADADAFTIPGTLLIGPEGYVVIAGAMATSEIAGDAVLPTGLGFGGSDAVSLTCGGTEIDAVDWSTMTFPSMDDVSTQLDNGLGAADNDDLTFWCLTPAGTTYGASTYGGSPGLPNPPCACPEASRVVINEVAYADASTDDEEFVELYNPTGAAVNVTGWTVALFNGSNNREYGSVTLTGSIAAGGYLVVTGNGSTITPSDASFSGNIQNGGPDGVALVDGPLATGSLVDFVTYDGAFSPADLLDSAGVVTYFTIPAAMNVSIGEDDDDAGSSLQRVSDACDRMMPMRDWGVAVGTPGAAN